MAASGTGIGGNDGLDKGIGMEKLVVGGEKVVKGGDIFGLGMDDNENFLTGDKTLDGHHPESEEDDKKPKVKGKGVELEVNHEKQAFMRFFFEKMPEEEKLKFLSFARRP